MRRDMIICGAAALALHAMLLSLPVVKIDARTGLNAFEPISISITHRASRIDGALPARQVPPSIEKMGPVGHAVRLEKKSVPSESATPIGVAPDEPAAGRPREVECNDSRIHSVEDGPARVALAGFGVSEKPQPAAGDPGMDGAIEERVVFARPKYKENPLPVYPKIARRRGYEGKTILRVKVLADGKTGRVEVEESSGFEMLDNAAVDSVSKWIFMPGAVNGKKMEQWINVPIRFVLE